MDIDELVLNRLTRIAAAVERAADAFEKVAKLIEFAHDEAHEESAESWCQNCSRVPVGKYSDICPACRELIARNATQPYTPEKP